MRRIPGADEEAAVLFQPDLMRRSKVEITRDLPGVPESPEQSGRFGAGSAGTDVTKWRLPKLWWGVGFATGSAATQQRSRYALQSK
jgi:hypothetical protein